MQDVDYFYEEVIALIEGYEPEIDKISRGVSLKAPGLKIQKRLNDYISTIRIAKRTAPKEEKEHMAIALEYMEGVSKNMHHAMEQLTSALSGWKAVVTVC